MGRSPFGDFDPRSILQSLRGGYDDAVSGFKPRQNLPYIAKRRPGPDRHLPDLVSLQEIGQCPAVEVYQNRPAGGETRPHFLGTKPAREKGNLDSPMTRFGFVTSLLSPSPP